MTKSSSGDKLTDAERIAERESLIESSLDLLFTEFDQALAEGMREPVVFLLDCEDEIGSQLARSWTGDQAVQDAILDTRAEAQDQGESGATTLLTRAFPFAECRQGIGDVFPYLIETFSGTGPDDGFLVVVVASGGADVFTAPYDARPGE